MKKKISDWTEPAYLNKEDWDLLKEIKRLHGEGKMEEAMYVACYEGDTVIREEIPPQIWLDMGGTLTKTGLEKLRQQKDKGKGESLER